MIKYAPVLIPTLNRHNHFSNCVKSLAQCIHADKTDLIIALDFPTKESHWDGYRKILEISKNIVGFKSVKIIKREKNFGPISNFFESITEVFKEYDNLIFTEDDNLFSTDFLNFVNEGLTLYRDRKDIFSISGYQYPVDMPKSYSQDIYVWTGFSAWGVGIWKDRWENAYISQEKALSDIKNMFQNYSNVFRLNKIANHYVPELIHMAEKKRLFADGYFSMYQFLKNQYSVFPIISRVRNMGHDGSGVNCGIKELDVYSDQDIYVDEKKSYSLPPEIKKENIIYSVFYNNFKRKKTALVKTIGKIFLINLKLYKL